MEVTKKSISAFFFYQKTIREFLKQEQPNLNYKEIISTMSDKWRKMSDEEKDIYNKIAEDDKERYETEKKALMLKI